jgi:hypothetical protein
LIYSWSTDEELYLNCCQQTTYTYLSDQLAPLLFKALNMPYSSEAYNKTLLPMIFKAIFSGLKTLYPKPSSAAAAGEAAATQPIVSEPTAAAVTQSMSEPAAAAGKTQIASVTTTPAPELQLQPQVVERVVESPLETIQRQLFLTPPLKSEQQSYLQPLEPLRPPENLVSSSRLQSSSLFSQPQPPPEQQQQRTTNARGAALAAMKASRGQPEVRQVATEELRRQQQQQQQQQQQEAAAAAVAAEELRRQEAAAATQPPEAAAQPSYIRRGLGALGNFAMQVPGVSALGSGFGRMFGYGYGRQQEQGGNRKRTRRYKKMNALTKKRIQKYKKKYTRVKRHHSRRKMN